jgi:hypothetical protein
VLHTSKNSDCSQVSLSEKALQQRFAQYQQGNILVELGYNIYCKKKDAKYLFRSSFRTHQEKPKEVYGIANSFERKVLWNTH